MLSLRILDGKQKGQEISISKAKVVVFGRSSSCSVRLGHPDVSRRHCALAYSVDGMVIRDLSSRTGTRVNGQLVDAEQPLQAGDRLQVGPYSFEVETTSPASVSEADIEDWLGDTVNATRSADDTAVDIAESLVATEEVDGVTVVRLRTPTLNAVNIQQISRRLVQFVHPKARLLLDLSAVEGVVSTGLVRIWSFVKQIEDSDGEVRLCGVQEVVLETLEATRMHKHFQIFRTQSDALAEW